MSRVVLTPMRAAKGTRKAARATRRAGRKGTAMDSVSMAAVEPKKVLMMGGTRFIGLYLARQLTEQGHEVTLFTRGKSEIAPRIPDDDDASYAAYSSKIKHIAVLPEHRGLHVGDPQSQRREDDA